ncbi:hypothetical protein PanWU01x14_144730, partial [Parasponia andersonii]
TNPTLCHFKYGTFVFYEGWLVAMTIFIALLLPDTKGVPLDSMFAVSERHWYLGRFVEGQALPQQGNSH